MFGSTSAGSTVTLVSNPGKYNFQPLASHGKSIELTASIRMVEFSGTERWPAGAYIGFYQGVNHDNSIQVFVLRENATDNFLKLSYRLLERGHEIDSVLLGSVPLNSPVEVSLMFSGGQAEFSVNSGPPLKLRTSLMKVVPYISVSSGAAIFNTSVNASFLRDSGYQSRLNSSGN